MRITIAEIREAGFLSCEYFKTTRGMKSSKKTARNSIFSMPNTREMTEKIYALIAPHTKIN